jgi:O-antigen/teichoic acid export membrane protein
VDRREASNDDEADGRERTQMVAISLRRRFVGGATWLVVGSVGGRVLSLAGTVVATRLLVPRAFGQLSYIQAVVTFVAGLAILGLNVAVTKSVAAARANSRSQAVALIGVSLRISAASGGVLAFAMFLFRSQVAELLGSPELADQLAHASVAVAAGAIFAVAIGALNGVESFRAVAVLSSIRSVLASSLMVSGAVLDGLAGAVVGWAMGECVAATAAVFTVVRRHRGLDGRRALREHPATWRSLRRIALPAFAASVAVTLALVLGQRLLTDQPFGYQAVAQFNIAYRWSLAVLFVPASIAPILLPLLANLRAEGAVTGFLRLFRTNLWLAVILTALPAATLIAIRGEVLGLSGSTYAAEPATFVVMMIATVPIALNSVMSQAALSLDAIAAWLLSDLALAVALAGVAWLLVPRHLSLGLAIGYGFGYLVTCAVLAFPLRRHVLELERTDREGSE